MARFWDKALKSSLAMLVVFSTLFFMSPNIKVEAKETISMLSGKERETGDILMVAGPEGRALSL